MQCGWPYFLLALFLAVVLTVEPAHGQAFKVQHGTTLQVQNGTVLDLQGGQMDLGDAGATARLQESGAGRVTGGTLTATRALESPSEADPAGLGAVISASADLGKVTVTRGHAVQTGGGNEGIARYYEISPSQNNDGLDATLTHTYHDDELNGLVESDLVFFKSEDGGSTWDKMGADSRVTDPTGSNTVTLESISAFSRWTLGADSTPLPVELAAFEGATTEDGVQLTWQTTSEQNNAGFKVQRRIGERRGESAWTEVGFVEGEGTTSAARTYRFTDADLPYAADSVHYRLRQEDIDGTVHVTDPVTVARGRPAGLQLLNTYPNPARKRATVRYGVPESVGGEVTLRLYDVVGRRVRSLEATAEAGRHEHQLDVSGLASGVYVLQLSDGGRAVTRRVTVVQ